MSTLRNAAALIVAGCALASAAACASSASVTVNPPASAAPATTAASPAAPATAPPAAPSPSALVMPTAEAAAKQLYAAWKAGDKNAAARVASPAAVTTLFGKSWATNKYFFGGCSGTECDYNYATGAVKMTVTGDATSGFTVSAVAFGNAG